MNVSGALRSLYRAARPRPRSHAVVLMYHRVADCDLDPWNLCVSPRRFGEHLEVLKSEFRILPVQDLARTDADGRAVAITFDDGYADNLHAAAPALEHHGVPACFFLTSGALDMSHEFWWDELERLLLRESALPSTIEISVGSRRVFETGRAAKPATDLRQQIDANPPWKAAVTTRLGFFYTVWQALRVLNEHDRRIALHEIAMQQAADGGTRASHRSMTGDEALRLAGIEGMQIGAHSVTHAVLPSLAREARSAEIRDSKRQLEKLLGRPVTGFAYPFGDYDTETSDLVREAGFEWACTTETGGVNRHTDLFRMPRLAAEDCDGRRLARRINDLLG
jgi:peptidoglycan/xylan/chitin deacetylase (PgdA/CDA1 family)